MVPRQRFSSMVDSDKLGVIFSESHSDVLTDVSERCSRLKEDAFSSFHLIDFICQHKLTLVSNCHERPPAMLVYSCVNVFSYLCQWSVFFSN